MYFLLVNGPLSSIRWWPWNRCSHFFFVVWKDGGAGGWAVRSGPGLGTQWVLRQCLLVEIYKAAGQEVDGASHFCPGRPPQQGCLREPQDILRTGTSLLSTRAVRWAQRACECNPGSVPFQLGDLGQVTQPSYEEKASSFLLLQSWQKDPKR